MEKLLGSAFIAYLTAGVLIYLGIDRIASYYMSDSEYSSAADKFAFVGNDADNLIINSNIYVAYFILAAAFIISGTLLLVTRTILMNINEKKEEIAVIEKKEEVKAIEIA